MNKVRKVLIFILILTITATSIISCNDSNEVRKGRYIEEEVDIGEIKGSILCIKEREDKVIDLVNKNEVGELSQYQSSDGGGNLGFISSILPQSSFEGEISGNNVAINENGEPFICYSKYTKEQMDKIKELEKRSKAGETVVTTGDELEPTKKFMIYKGNNEYKDIDLSSLNIDIVGQIKYAPNGDLFISSIQRGGDKKTIYQLDKDSFKVKNEYELKTGTADLTDFCFLDNEVVIVNNGDVTRYNLKNGKKISKIKIKMSNNMVNEGVNITSNEKDTIYYKGSKGLYSYKIDDKKPKLIIDGLSSTIGDIDYWCHDFISCKNGDFLGVFSKKSSDKANKLIRFKYDKDALFKAKEKLTIYSLYENTLIKQAIINYQKKNPNLYINYESAISFDEMFSGKEILTSDIIKALNTEIMAGKGPDIVLLEGLPSESYKDKDILLDLSPIINKQDGKLFDSITKACTKNGKVYSYPLSISLPRIVGKDIEGVSDLKSLSDKIEKMDSNDRNILDVYNENELLCYLYKSSSYSWIKDKKLNEDRLKEFLECSKKILNKVIASHSEEEIDKHKKLLKDPEEYYKSLDLNYRDKLKTSGNCMYNCLFDNSPKFSIGKIPYTNDLRRLAVYKENFGVNNNVWNGQIGSYFYSSDEIAITKNSKNKEAAEKFVESLLEEDFQSTLYSGLSINKAVLEKSLINLEDYELEEYTEYNFQNEKDTKSYKTRPFSKEEINSLFKEIESKEISVAFDITLYDKIKEYILNYIAGKTNIDDAMNKIKSSLEIYLSE